MVEINGVLISSEIMTEHFVCNLNACKGACCWEGDYGAPVSEKEMADIKSNIEEIKIKLPVVSKTYLANNEMFTYYEKDEVWGTGLHPDGACVFLTKDELGISKCGIEQAYHDGVSTTNKPISCHLYPIRVLKYEDLGFESWNYDRWEICSEACVLGDKLKLPLYEFVKDAIIRYKGQDFYDQLKAAGEHLKSQQLKS